MSSAPQVPCPGCGVWISSGQGRCAFCLRRAEAERASYRRWVLVAALLAAAILVVAGAALFRHRQRMADELAPAPSIVPVFEPTLVRHTVQINESTLSIDGQSLMEIRPLFEEHRDGLVGKEPAGPRGTSASDQLERAVRLAYARPGFTRDRLVVEATPGVPLGVVIDVMNAAAAAGFSTKSVSVPPSAGLPAATFYTLVATPGVTRKEALWVQLNHASLDLVLFDPEGRHEVGESCKVDAGGLALRYTGEPEFSTMLACLTALRARVPASEPANARLEGRAETPIGAFVHIANALRCGKPDCPERPTRLWGEFFFQTIPVQLRPAVSQLVERAEPALTECYQAHRAELTAPAYEVEGKVSFTKGKAPQLKLEPGLPAVLESCVHSVFAREKIADLDGADLKRAYYVQLLIHGRDWHPAW